MRHQSKRARILGEKQGYHRDTLVLQNLAMSDSGQYYCLSNGFGKSNTDRSAMCFDVLVVPRVKGGFVTPVDGITADGQQVIEGWGGAEGERYVLPGDWRQYGEVVEQIMIDDPRENLTLDCTVSKCVNWSTVSAIAISVHAFKVEGFVSPYYVWTKDGNCDLEEGFSSSVLRRSDLTWANAGEYKCTVPSPR